MCAWEPGNVITGNLRRYDLFVIWSATINSCPVVLPKRLPIVHFHSMIHIERHLKNLVLVSLASSNLQIRIHSTYIAVIENIVGQEAVQQWLGGDSDVW